MELINYIDDKIVESQNSKILALISLMNKTGIHFNSTPVCFEWDDGDDRMAYVRDSGGTLVGCITKELYEKLSGEK